MRYTSVGGVPLNADGTSPAAPVVLVKDGTMSGRQEKLIKENEADANRRRKHQDIQRQMSDQRVGGGGVARLGSRQLVTQDSPRLVLFYRKWDQYCLSEITIVNKPISEGLGVETMFTLVCPKCLRRGIPQGQAQLQIRSSHRSFDVDTKKAGPRRITVAGQIQHVYQHGTVTVNDKVRCSAAQCDWCVRIIDSVVDEA